MDERVSIMSWEFITELTQVMCAEEVRYQQWFNDAKWRDKNKTKIRQRDNDAQKYWARQNKALDEMIFTPFGEL